MLALAASLVDGGRSRRRSIAFASVTGHLAVEIRDEKTGEPADAEARQLCAVYLLTTTAARYFPRFGFVETGRDAVPADVAATDEFRSACPASALAMVRPCATH